MCFQNDFSTKWIREPLPSVPMTLSFSLFESPLLHSLGLQHGVITCVVKGVLRTMRLRPVVHPHVATAIPHVHEVSEEHNLLGFETSFQLFAS